MCLEILDDMAELSLEVIEASEVMAALVAIHVILILSSRWEALRPATAIGALGTGIHLHAGFSFILIKAMDAVRRA